MGKKGGRREGRDGRRRDERRGGELEGGRDEKREGRDSGRKEREGRWERGRDLQELVLKLLHLAWLCSQLHEQVQPERHHRVEDPHECLLCQQLLPEQLVEEEEERE